MPPGDDSNASVISTYVDNATISGVPSTAGFHQVIADVGDDLAVAHVG